MDIFVNLVEEGKLHPNFISTRDNSYKRTVINGWADQALVDRDGRDKFIKEFQTEFNTSLWELCCYQLLKSLGCTFDFSKSYPDFVSDYKQERFLLECVIANNADGTPRESNYEAKLNDNSSLDEKVMAQVLRLSNAIDKKHKKYHDTYLKDQDNNDKPYVIAVEPFDQPWFMDTGVESIETLLYGWVYNRYNKTEEYCKTVKKNDNCDIPIGIFSDSSYEDVSGILFSNLASIGKVSAMGNEPRLSFLQVRRSPFYKAEIRVDCRIPYNRYDPYCKTIRKKFSRKDEFYNQFSPSKPFVHWGVNYCETIFDGFNYFVNPYAKHPISKELLDKMYDSGINIFNYDVETNAYDCRLVIGSLVNRKVYI